MKTILKTLLYRMPFLQMPFIWVYKLMGKRPFSLGYSFYRNAFIQKILNEGLFYFEMHQLPEGYGIGMDERVVEYPWLFSKIKDGQRRILDAGSTLNHKDILNLPFWRDRELDIVTLENEGQWSTKNKIRYNYQDIRSLDFQDGEFDVITCLSTLEHVGMDNTMLYSQKIQMKEGDTQGYLKAVKELKRVLKNGGTLYLTMPYGEHKNMGWFQIFDDTMVENLLKEFQPNHVDSTYFKYTPQGWVFSSSEDCSRGRYFDIHRDRSWRAGDVVAAECVVCLALSH